MSTRLKISSYVLPITILALIGIQIINPSPVWKGILAALGGCWLLSYLWARSLQSNLYLERAMRFGWVQVGDLLEERFTLFNEGWFPATWVEVSDRSNLPGYSIARATGVSGFSQNEWRTTGTCTRRGIFTLGYTRIRCGDPLGIYQVEIEQSESVTLSVMPPVISLPPIEITPSGWIGEGHPRRHAPEQTVNSAGIRQYHHGDSMRLIHWPTTARRNEPYVRLLEGAPSGDWWIILDFERLVQVHGDESETTEELGVILTASLADRGLNSNHPVGLIASGKEPIWMRPDNGDHRRWEILRAMALLEPGEVPLESILESMASGLGQQASLIVITPSLKSEWLKPLMNLFWRGFTPTVILVDPTTFGSPANTKPLDSLLIEMNIPHHIVSRDLFKRTDTHPGQSGQWEWRIMPTGKAVPVRLPGDLTWRGLK